MSQPDGLAIARARAAAYAAIFDNPTGAQVLEDLEALYGRRLFFMGNSPTMDGRRRTDFALGAFAVLEHIKLQVRRHQRGIDDSPEPEATPPY